MKSQKLSSVIALAAFTLFLIPANLATQDAAAPAKKAQHHHYKLIDMGTFGGSGSFVNDSVSPLVNNSVGLNKRGVAWGASATSIPTLPTSNFLVCDGDDVPTGFVARSFRWQDGIITDLGALPGVNNCSIPMAINVNGEAIGISENGEVDPLTGVNTTRAVRWADGNIEDLGSFGGNQNAALRLNTRGQIVGYSLNAIPDPYSPIEAILGSSNGTQTRAALWKHGHMQDLGTLGTGNDAIAGLINEHGQIAGISYTTSDANPATGIPTLDPFFWDNGKMVDIGSIGGAIGFTMALNNHGQVIGLSSVAADPGACLFGPEGNSDCHPFLWQGGTLTDLYTSTKGGNPLVAYGINDLGEIVGIGSFPNAPSDAYLWRDGVMTDLGRLSDCGSFANSINSRSQVVGGTFSCQDGTHARAFLWEKGSIIDLNSVIPPDSPLQLVAGVGINDRGEISGDGVPPGVPPSNYSTQGHAFLLIPCDDDHPNVEGCDYSLVDASVAATAVLAAPATKAASTFIQGNPAFGGAANPMLRRFSSRFGPWNRAMGAERPAMTPMSVPLAP
jgi:probable HAF family extracellular repeat protein